MGLGSHLPTGHLRSEALVLPCVGAGRRGAQNLLSYLGIALWAEDSKLFLSLSLEFYGW